jgi:hypothetical protein
VPFGHSNAPNANYAVNMQAYKYNGTCADTSSFLVFVKGLDVVIIKSSPQMAIYRLRGRIWLDVCLGFEPRGARSTRLKVIATWKGGGAVLMPSFNYNLAFAVQPRKIMETVSEGIREVRGLVR